MTPKPSAAELLEMLESVAKDAAGFNGRFFYDAERGDIGYIAKECDDKQCDCEKRLNADGDQDCSVSVVDADDLGIDDIAEPLARLLNVALHAPALAQCLRGLVVDQASCEARLDTACTQINAAIAERDEARATAEDFNNQRVACARMHEVATQRAVDLKARVEHLTTELAAARAAAARAQGELDGLHVSEAFHRDRCDKLEMAAVRKLLPKEQDSFKGCCPLCATRDDSHGLLRARASLANKRAGRLAETIAAWLEQHADDVGVAGPALREAADQIRVNWSKESLDTALSTAKEPSDGE